jgi:hypothetical protein
MKTEGEGKGFRTPCRLIEHLVEEWALLYLVLPDGRQIELDRRRPGTSIDPEGIATICSLIRMEVPTPVLQEPAPGDLGMLGYEVWRLVREELQGSGRDPESLMPIY